MLRKGSRSRRLWELPPISSERYERRPCLCVFVARFDRRIFLLFVKNGFVGAFAEGNGAPAETKPPAVALAPRSNFASCCYGYAIVSVSCMANGGRCNLRGVLKITPPNWAQSVSYHMTVENSTLSFVKHWRLTHQQRLG